MAKPPLSRADTWTSRITVRSKQTDWLLLSASFLETIMIPIPIELVIIPLMIKAQSRAYWIASVVLAGCIVGAIAGYVFGYLFMQSAGDWIITQLDWQDDVSQFKLWFDDWGFWAIVAVGILPIPFQVAILVAGATLYSPALFILATAIARGIRYYGLAILVTLFGETILSLWKKLDSSNKWFLAAIVIMVVAGYGTFQILSNG